MFMISKSKSIRLIKALTQSFWCCKGAEKVLSMEDLWVSSMGL